MSISSPRSWIHGTLLKKIRKIWSRYQCLQIQTGDPGGTGSGGESYWGIPFRDEHDLKGAAKHDSRGILAMANKGANTNGRVYFTVLVYCLLKKSLQLSVLSNFQSGTPPRQETYGVW